MKKFRFSLETVLDYKQEVLSALQTEHAAILARVHAQEDLLEELENYYSELDAEFTERKLEGITILDAMQYEQYLRATERQIEEAVEILERLRAEAEAKRLEVVEAKKDTSSIEKLREKKLDSYNKAVQKSEELIIEEFVTTTRVMAAQGAYA
ncbi:MAG: flagellar export protein FliJ [Oscillospiraceae bacterium]|jgi:flagellar FliJ protein|nr:flagellar export protein FliJ [Oscillospiraceae bacterium]